MTKSRLSKKYIQLLKRLFDVYEKNNVEINTWVIERTLDNSIFFSRCPPCLLENGKESKHDLDDERIQFLVGKYKEMNKDAILNGINIILIRVSLGEGGGLLIINETKKIRKIMQLPIEMKGGFYVKVFQKIKSNHQKDK